MNNLFSENNNINISNLSLDKANNYEIVKNDNGEIILDVNVSPNENTVWLSQNDIAELFSTNKQLISYHISNIFSENELEEWSAVKEILTTAADGKNYKVSYYNLDMIISIGYRVNSKRGIAFRRWATSVLKSYLLNGFSISEKRCLECKENIISLNNKVELLINKDIEKDKRINALENTDTLLKDKLFYEGQIYETYSYIKHMFLSAIERIIIIDGYIDITVLDMLSDSYVPITIYTYPCAMIKNLDIEKFKVNHNLEVIKTPTFHNRYILIDDKLFSCGHSIKDVGKKCFSIHNILDFTIDDLLKKMNCWYNYLLWYNKYGI